MREKKTFKLHSVLNLAQLTSHCKGVIGDINKVLIFLCQPYLIIPIQLWLSNFTTLLITLGILKIIIEPTSQCYIGS